MLAFISVFAQKGFNNVSAFKYDERRVSNSPLPTDDPRNNETINLSKKLLKHFNKKFHNAGNVKWEQVDDYFLATFIKNHLTAESLFDRKGRLIYTIDYSNGEELPDNVKNLIMHNYKTYIITSVAKVEGDGRKIWVVKLAGTKDYITARVEDGEIEETENFEKAN